ncbi:MAG: mechanosensitive ion channel [Eubacteriales bacterium]|nr:mechanosensitive ion channel [Eubacteriales bacterium]
MEKNNKKIALAVILAVIGAVLLIFVVGRFLDVKLTSRQNAASVEKLELVSEMIGDMDKKAAELTAEFDDLSISAADAMALMAREVPDFKMDHDQMAELQRTTGVDNVLVINERGDIICTASNNPRDYSLNRFNQLRDAFNASTGKSAEPFTVSWEDTTVRYYGAAIDNNYMIVVAQNTASLDKKIADLASLESTLGGVHVGQNGFMAVVSTLDHIVKYFPDKSVVGTNAVSHGLDPELIEDGLSTYLDFNGDAFYCTMGQIGDDMYICAVPKSEIVTSRNRLVVMAFVIYAITATLMILYAHFVRKDRTVEAEGADFGKFVNGRLSGMAIAGAIVIFVLVFYLGSLMSISRQSVTNNSRLKETVQSLEDSGDEYNYLKNQYDNDYLAKARLAALIIGRMDESRLDRAFMNELKAALKTNCVEVFDMEGSIKASSSDFWGFKIPTDENAVSYEFWDILNGTKEEIVQDAQKKDSTDDIVQYICVAVKDETYRTCGLVSLELSPNLIQKTLANASLSSVLSNVQTGNNGFAFAVNTDTEKFDYYPNPDYIGRSSLITGISEDELIPGSNEFITIDGEQYYCASSEHGDDLIYIAVPMRTLNDISLPTAGVVFGFALVWLLILWFVLGFGISKEVLAADPDDDADVEKQISVSRADGSKVLTRSIMNRFSLKGVPWSSLSAGQKVSLIVRSVLIVLAVALFIMMLAADRIFAEDSLILYILRGAWRKRLNIFAVTKCIILIIAFNVCGIAARKLISWFAERMDAKGETICRLVNSFIKFGIMIALIYICLDLLGVDTSVLLTSAGILSLVVGLGANSLIKDILAGLMIVFEGAFQVGDIVTIGGFRGTVVEIGLRTTKVKEGAGNIKIFSNSGIGDVLNMTKDYSVVACDMSIEYGEDLQYVESILADEFDNIRKNLPAIKDGPFYKGVADLADSAVIIKIIAKCNEGDRIQLDRDLRRQLKLIFDKYNINIPFPQIVLNQPTEGFHHANVLVQQAADEFNEEQKEESAGIYSDEAGR